MDQFKSWTPKKYNFLTADQQLTARVHRLYRTLLGLTPILFSSGSDPRFLLRDYPNEIGL